MNELRAQLQDSYHAADTGVDLVDLTAGDLLSRAALAHPARTALVEVGSPAAPSLTGADSTDRRWTYAQLWQQSQQCAAWLLERFQPGERICVYAPNVPEWVILQYAAAYAGLVLVTANPALRP
ncbi:MAG: AMP-binding protein [Burkholderiales bacterium]|nr:AMP-binding protein [Burkholderiales bacterium]